MKALLSSLFVRDKTPCDPFEGWVEAKQGIADLHASNWEAFGRTLEALRPCSSRRLLEVVRRNLPEADLPMPDSDDPTIRMAAVLLDADFPTVLKDPKAFDTEAGRHAYRAHLARGQTILTDVLAARPDDAVVISGLIHGARLQGASLTTRRGLLDRAARAEPLSLRCVMRCVQAIRPGPFDAPDLTPMWRATEDLLASDRSAPLQALYPAALIIDFAWHDLECTDALLRKRSLRVRGGEDIAQRLASSNAAFQEALPILSADGRQLGHNLFAAAFLQLGAPAGAAPHLREIGAYPMLDIWGGWLGQMTLRDLNRLREAAMLPPVTLADATE